MALRVDTSRYQLQSAFSIIFVVFWRVDLQIFSQLISRAGAGTVVVVEKFGISKVLIVIDAWTKYACLRKKTESLSCGFFAY